MTPDEAATLLAETTAQRDLERAGDAAAYRLRKACEARAVELHENLSMVYSALAGAPFLQNHFPGAAVLLTDIKDDAS